MRKSILMVFPLAPWPARAHGVSIRYYPVIEKLAEHYDIDMAVLGDDRGEVPDDPVVAKLRTLRVEHFNRNVKPGIFDRVATLAESFGPFGAPYCLAQYRSGEVRKFITRFLDERKYDSVLWVGYDFRRVLNQLLPRLQKSRVVYDNIDSIYLHLSRTRSACGVKRLFESYSLWKTKRFERKLTEGVKSVYISQTDAAAAFDGVNAESAVIPNGILTDDFRIGSLDVNPCIGFLGHMGYGPNIDGALRLHREVFLPLRDSIPNLKMRIIGRYPDPKIQALAGPDITVTGEVENIWDHIAKVNVFVFPMRSGAGLQNKILEAMYAGKPVVTTEICRSSVEAVHAEQIYAANTTREIVAYTKMLLENPTAANWLAENGKRYVSERYYLPRVIDSFERLLVA